MIRVVIVDDMPTVRQAVRRLLSADGEISIVAEGRDGAEAVELVCKHKPDIVLMDVDMPRMDGLAATREIMEKCATPILIVTSTAVYDKRHMPFAAIEAGALEVMLKPSVSAAGGWEAVGATLRRTVRLLSQVRVVHRRRRVTPQPPARVHQTQSIPAGWKPSVIVIGASTGGPVVLRQILSALPADYPIPIVVVQHIGDEFVPGLVDWLGGNATLRVALAGDRQQVAAGTAAIAPGGVHIRVTEGPSIRFDSGPMVQHCRPSVDVLFQSAAQTFGSKVVSVLLTGMGRDGADGTRIIRDAGGVTLAQDAETSTVYGMPGAAAELGAVQHILPPSGIINMLMSLATPRKESAR